MVAAALVFFVRLPAAAHVLIIVSCAVVGIIASGVAEEVIGKKDSGHIIIDEFVGMLISVLFIPLTAGYILAGFLLFRLFDIFKPFPIRQIESSLKGGIGIMADDIAAGIAANIFIQAWKTIS